MVYIVYLLLYVGMLVLFLFLVLMAVYSARAVLYGWSPFIPAQQSVVADIVQSLELKAGAVVYDLGCGDGRVLIAAVKTIPGIRGVGIERNWLAWVLAKYRSRHFTVEIKRGDFFDPSFSLTSETHVYCYLLTDVLTKLEPRIIQECRPGARIVSCDFLFPNLKPLKEITLPNRKMQLIKKIYVYEI